MPPPRPQRVLVVTPAGIGGGLHRVALSVRDGLADLGWDARATSPHAPGFRGAAARRGSRKRQAQVAADLARLVLTTRRFRPDAVSLHVGGPSAMRPYLRAIQLGGCRTVLVTFHTAGSDSHWTPRAVRSAWRCSALVVLSETAAFAHRAGGAPASLLHVVPNGVAPPGATGVIAGARARFGLPGDGFTALMAGRLVPSKGVDDAVRAIAALPGAILLVAGDGPSRPAAEALASRLAPGRIHFAGWLDPGAMASAYAAVDAFILPTRLESFCLAFAEAASFGLPGVGYRIPGVEQVVAHGETGFLAGEGDVASLTASLARLSQEPALARAMGAAARARIAANFGLEQMAASYDRLLRAALPGPGHA